MTRARLIETRGEEPAVLPGPGETVLVPTGIFLEIPRGFEAQIRPRSGLALRHGLDLVLCASAAEHLRHAGLVAVLPHAGAAVVLCAASFLLGRRLGGLVGVEADLAQWRPILEFVSPTLLAAPAEIAVRVF